MAGIVRIGVVGAGGIGGTHRRAIKEVAGCRLAAVCDVNPQILERVSNEENVPAFDDPVKMYRSGLVDAVCVCTPHWFHPELAMKALAAGLHVLSEKPMAVTVSGCDRMIEAARKARKVLQVVYQRRYLPAVRKCHQLVKGGALGRIIRVQMTAAFFRSQAYYDSGDWRGTWAGEGGGVLVNQASHPIDAMLYVCCMDPVKVYGACGTLLHHVEAEDSADAIMWFKNGATGYFHACTCEAPQEEKIEIVGTTGKLALQGGRLIHWKTKPPTDAYIRTSKEAYGGPEVTEKDVSPKPAERRAEHYYLMKDFVAAIRYGRTPQVTGEEGRRSVEVINATILSSMTGKPVELPVNRWAYDALIKRLVAGSKYKKRRKR